MLTLRACVVLVALFAACDKKQAPPKDEPKPAAPPSPPPPPADPFASWTERAGDGFSVLAPQDPKVEKGQSMASGTKSETTIYTHYIPDGPGAIQVMFAQLDEQAKPDPKTVFGAMKDAMTKPFGGTITKDEDATVGKVAGREIWFDGKHPQMGPMSVRVKFFLDTDKKRLYLVQGMWSTAAPEFGAQAEKFLGSFRLR